jgi:hypothetical protein
MIPQPNSDETDLISNFHFCIKLRIDYLGAYARECESIMQVIMESIIGWNFWEQKQSSLGICGEVWGLSNATEEQARCTLHSHMLLFIAQFDTLIVML